MTTKSTFSIGSALSFAFKKFRENWTTFLVVSFTWLAVWLIFFSDAVVLAQWLGLPLSEAKKAFMPDAFCFQFSSAHSYCFRLIGLTFGLFMYYKLLRFGIALSENTSMTLREIYSINLRTFLRFLGARLLLSIKYILGLLFFILPGLYLWTKYYFAGFTIIDDPSNTITDDTKLNRLVTKGIKLKLFILALLCYLFVLVSLVLLARIFPALIALWLALFIAPPLYTLVQSHIYTQLKRSRNI